MHLYRYEAESRNGEVVRGVLTAPDLVTARNDVEAQLLLPLKVLEIPEERPRRPAPPQGPLAVRG
jgi:type II secretory pathway component PulF